MIKTITLSIEQFRSCIEGIYSTIYYENCMPSEIPILELTREKLISVLEDDSEYIILIDKKEDTFEEYMSKKEDLNNHSKDT